MEIIDVFIFERAEAGKQTIEDSFIDSAQDFVEVIDSSALFFITPESFIKAYKSGLYKNSFRLWVHYMFHDPQKPENSKGIRTARKIKKELPELIINLITREKSPPDYDGFKAYRLDDLSDINSFDIASVLYNSQFSKHNIFVSHASADEKLVRNFTNKILHNGLQINPSNIFCTSIESMGIKTGDDFRQAIYDNMFNSSIVLLMLSNNYKKSEVCLNEMGAGWALDKTIFPLLIPPVKFKTAGCLMEVKQGIMLNDETKLLKMCQDLKTDFSLKTDLNAINSSIKDFLTVI